MASPSSVMRMYLLRKRVRPEKRYQSARYQRAQTLQRPTSLVLAPPPSADPITVEVEGRRGRFSGVKRPVVAFISAPPCAVPAVSSISACNSVP